MIRNSNDLWSDAGISPVEKKTRQLYTSAYSHCQTSTDGKSSIEALVKFTETTTTTKDQERNPIPVRPATEASPARTHTTQTLVCSCVTDMLWRKLLGRFSSRHTQPWPLNPLSRFNLPPFLLSATWLVKYEKRLRVGYEIQSPSRKIDSVGVGLFVKTCQQVIFVSVSLTSTLHHLSS